jgi:hypothetical protein
MEPIILAMGCEGIIDPGQLFSHLLLGYNVSIDPIAENQKIMPGGHRLINAVPGQHCLFRYSFGSHHNAFLRQFKMKGAAQYLGSIDLVLRLEL